MMFGSVSEHFANLRQVKIIKPCVSSLNTMFWGTEVVKHPFYSVGPKMMFQSDSEHFVIFGTENMQNLSSGLNALFRGTEVVKPPLYSIGPK
jgi:hypothetical protein